jgi:D-tyrosyl-tRNA(Tyr) deacylase
VRAVVTRVSNAQVRVDGAVVGSIEGGLLALVGVAADDTIDDAVYLARKTVALRIFRDADAPMNLALGDVAGSLLVVSQFTLLGDVRKGRRPSFASAAGGDLGRLLYERFIGEARALGVRVESGRFGAMMEVASTNDGPVTILLDSKRTF